MSCGARGWGARPAVLWSCTDRLYKRVKDVQLSGQIQAPGKAQVAAKGQQASRMCVVDWNKDHTTRLERGQRSGHESAYVYAPNNASTKHGWHTHTGSAMVSWGLLAAGKGHAATVEPVKESTATSWVPQLR